MFNWVLLKANVVQGTIVPVWRICGVPFQSSDSFDNFLECLDSVPKELSDLTPFRLVILVDISWMYIRLDSIIGVTAPSGFGFSALFLDPLYRDGIPIAYEIMEIQEQRYRHLADCLLAVRRSTFKVGVIIRFVSDPDM